ncbi:hypothetical protein TRVL_08207 [Trypanosoma vivax]|nr:hypothetical protein TRVL_08207 [Trypanosoma vivax]
MQARLHFRFPQKQRQLPEKRVSVQVFVPVPKQRPCQVANFFYMCTGELPSVDLMCAIAGADHMEGSTTVGSFSDLLRDVKQSEGLKPFSETSVVRIEKGVMMEIGASTTKTIFGGFIKDEPLTDTAGETTASCAKAINALQELHAGTLLVSNMGMPNSNGSRYYILLADILSSDRKKEFGAYQPLGVITDGLQALREACEATSVHTRTLAPHRNVKIEGSEISITSNTEPGFPSGVSNATSAVAKIKGTQEGMSVERTAGRVRCREEYEQEVVGEGEKECSKSSFFDWSRAFPSTPGSGEMATVVYKSEMPQMKRMRTERVVVNSDGMASLRTTAVEHADGEEFDYMAAQEAAFLNDIELIAQTQSLRQSRRAARQQRQNRLSRNGTAQGMRLVDGKGGRSGRTATVRGSKTLKRRY